MNHRDFIYFLNFVCLVCSMAVAGALVGWGDWEKATFALVAAVFFQNTKIQMDMYQDD